MTSTPPLPTTSGPPGSAAKQAAFLPAVCVGILIALIGVVSAGSMAVLISDSDRVDGKDAETPNTETNETGETEVPANTNNTSDQNQSGTPTEATGDTATGANRTPPGDGDDAAAPAGTGESTVTRIEESAAAEQPQATSPELSSAGQPAAATVAPPAAPRPLDDIRARQNTLPISTSPSYQHRLCRIPDIAADELVLSLEAPQFHGPGSPSIGLRKIGTGSESAWEAVRENQSGSSRSSLCGQFTLVNHELIWTWHADADRDMLPFCLLHVVATTKNVTDAELCQLWRPEEHDGIALQFAETLSETRLLPEVRNLPLPQNFELEVDLVGYPAYRIDGSQSLAFEEQTDIVILSPADDTQELLHLHVSFRGSEKRLSVLVEPHADMPVQSPRRRSAANQTRMQPFRRADAGRQRKNAEKGIQDAETTIATLERSIEALEEVIQLRPADRASRERLIGAREALLQAEDAKAELEKLLAWAEGVDQLCTTLEQNSRITCRLVRRTQDNRQVEILVPSPRLLQNLPPGAPR